MAGQIYIGIAGWSYPDWNGIVYTSSRMDQLEYVSSSALRVFLMTLKTLKKKNGRFVLFGLQPQIREVFDISGFLDLFQIYTHRKEVLD